MKWTLINFLLSCILVSDAYASSWWNHSVDSFFKGRENLPEDYEEAKKLFLEKWKKESTKEDTKPIVKKEKPVVDRKPASVKGSPYKDFEFQFAWSYFSGDSSSEFSFLDYSSSSHGFFLNADLWMTEDWGISSNYQRSLGARLEPFNGDSSQSVEHEFFLWGLKYRIDISHSLGDLLILGLNYRTYQFKVPQDSVSRGFIKRTGLGLTAELQKKLSSRFQIRYALMLYPVEDFEQSQSSIDTSGGEVDSSWSYQLNTSLHYQVQPHHEVFLKMQYEQNRVGFSGNTLLNEPSRAMPLSSIGVDQNFFILSIGYSWGF